EPVDLKGESTMTDGALRGSGWGRALARTSAWLVLGGLLLGLSYSANVLAQKKTDPKKSDVQKSDKKPAPKKPGPKKPDAKPIVDVLATDDGAAQVAYINEELQKQWKENKITPSERCTDYEFIRRASLDLIGRIATPEEITRFMKDKPEK